MSILDDVDEPSTTAGFGEAFNGVVEEDVPGDNAKAADVPLVEEALSMSNRMIDELRHAANAWRRIRPKTDPRLDAHATGRAHGAFRDAFAGSSVRSPEMNVVLDVADAARVLVYRGLRAAAMRLQDFATRLANRITPTH